jgi:hypothetical protein
VPAHDSDVADVLGRDSLPDVYERWRLELAPGASQPTSGAEWAGALVLVETGELRVDCLAGGSRTFFAGDLLALAKLPLRMLVNPGTVAVRLIAVRRRKDGVT